MRLRGVWPKSSGWGEVAEDADDPDESAGIIDLDDVGRHREAFVAGALEGRVDEGIIDVPDRGNEFGASGRVVATNSRIGPLMRDWRDRRGRSQAVISFVSNQRSRRRSSQVRRVIIVGAVVACVVGVAIVLRNRAQRRSNDVIEG